jgi:hypothetical protein
MCGCSSIHFQKICFLRSIAINPLGMITGCGFGPARTKDHPLPETFFAMRCSPHTGLASVGTPAYGPSGVDKRFEGQANHHTWGRASGAQVICPPQCNSRVPWPKRLRRWLAGGRPIVETVYEKLCIPSASIANGPMTSADCRRAWPQRSRCIIVVSGSMSNSAGHAWLLQTWWPGNFVGFHTKRLNRYHCLFQRLRAERVGESLPSI